MCRWGRPGVGFGGLPPTKHDLLPTLLGVTLTAVSQQAAQEGDTQGFKDSLDMLTFDGDGGGQTGEGRIEKIFNEVFPAPHSASLLTAAMCHRMG
jgi:hypothetical protein